MTRACLDEEEATIAPNLWSPWGYSLFFRIMAVATRENRCLCFIIFFRKNTTKKMTSWRTLVGSFEFRAQNPLIHLFSFILFIRYYMLTTRAVVQWQGTYAGNIHDLGSSPRSSLSQYYFSIYVHVQFQKQGRTIHCQDPMSTRPTSSIQGPGIREHGRLQSIRPHASQKVNKAKGSLGQNCYNYTS